MIDSKDLIRWDKIKRDAIRNNCILRVVESKDINNNFMINCKNKDFGFDTLDQVSAFLEGYQWGKHHD